jgi:hypothetical protein
MVAHHRKLGDTMMSGTIARVRSAGAWLLNPTCLIDRLLDQLDKLRVVVLAVPARGPDLSRSEAPLEARLEHFVA